MAARKRPTSAIRRVWRAGFLLVAFVVLAPNVGVVGVADTAAPAAAQESFAPLPAPGLYESLVPARIYDTRNDIGGPPGALTRKEVRTVDVTGVGGVPDSGVTAVALNVTAADPTGVSYLTVWPAGAPRPTASNLNFGPGQNVPNMVIAKVGTGGQVNIYNDVGNTHVIVDVVGYFANALTQPDGATYESLTPARVFDTRNTIGGPPGVLGAKSTVPVSVVGRGGVPTDGVTAVALNVTATEPTGNSFLTVWPAGEPRPNASNLNFGPGLTIANMVIAKVGAGGQINIYNDVGNTHVIVDVVGYFTPLADSGLQQAMSPVRIMDTRSGLGIIGGAVRDGERIDLTVIGPVSVGGLPTSGVSAVVLNVTATEPTGNSFLTVWPTGEPRPNASNLNFTPDRTVPNMVIAKVGLDGKISIYNDTATAHVIVDVVGYFTADNPNPLSSHPPQLASDALASVAATSATIAAVGPAGPGDAAGIASVAADLARRTVTRPLTDDDLDPSSYTAGVASSSISTSTGLLIRYIYDPDQPDVAPLPWSQCSATTVGLNAVVTAYHCTDETWLSPDNLASHPELGDYVFHSWAFAPQASGTVAPFGWFVTSEPGQFVAEVETLPDDYELFDFFPPLDYVIIPFEPNAAATEHPGADVGDVAGYHDVLLYSPGGPRIIAGYAGSDADSCPVAFGDDLDCYQSFCFADIAAWVPYRGNAFFEWATTCQSKPGMSGGPSFELYDGRWTLAGVISSGTIEGSGSVGFPATFGSYLGDDFVALMQATGVRLA